LSSVVAVDEKEVFIVDKTLRLRNIGRLYLKPTSLKIGDFYLGIVYGVWYILL